MATNFTCTINKTGEDYGTITAWEAAIEADLTSAATKVFSHGGITGTIADGASVTGLTSGATGVVTHATATQIMIKTITGTFQSGEVVYQTISVNLVTISDAGDSVIAIAECYDDDGTLTDSPVISGSTTSATNYLKITVPSADRHNGTISTGFKITGQWTLSTSYTIIEWLIITFTNNSSSSYYTVNYQTGNTSSIIRRCIIYNCSNSGSGLASGVGGSGTSISVLNCIAYGNENQGFGFSNSSNTHNMFNCTAYGNAVGFAGGNGTQVCKNCLAIGNTTADYSGIDSMTTSGAGDTTGTTDNLVAADEFVDPTGGTPDFHLKSGALSIGSGTDLGSTDGVNVDIDSTTRVAWDFGADYYVVAGTSVNVQPVVVSLLVVSSVRRIDDSQLISPVIGILSVIAPTLNTGNSVSKNISPVVGNLSVVSPAISISKSVSVQPVVINLSVISPSVSTGAPVDVSFQEGVSGYTGTLDTYLNQDATTTNYENDDLALPYAFSSHAHRNLIKFDVSSIPSGSTVTAASLELRIKSGLSGDNCTSRVRRLIRDWTESGATWNTYDGSNSWGAAGAQDTSTDIVASDDATNVRSSISSPVTITITGLETLVNGWVNGTYPNYGMVVYSDAEGDANGVVGSSEDGTSSNRPKLNVTYTTSAGINVSVSVVSGIASVISITPKIDKGLSPVVGVLSVPSPTVSTGNSVSKSVQPVVGNLSVIAPTLNITDSQSVSVVVAVSNVPAVTPSPSKSPNAVSVLGNVPTVSKKVDVNVSCLRLVSTVNAVSISTPDKVVNVQPITGILSVVSPSVQAGTSASVNVQPVVISVSVTSFDKQNSKSPNAITGSCSVGGVTPKVAKDLSPIQLIALAVPISAITTTGNKTFNASPIVGRLSVESAFISSSSTSLRVKRLSTKNNQSKSIARSNNLENKFSVKGGLI